MNKSYGRWAAELLALLLAVLTLCAAVVYWVDPCLYYRIPERRQPVFFNERYQAAGIAKNVPADTVILGTSMAANYRGSQAAEAFGGTAVRITLPDGYFSEFDQVMDVLFRRKDPPKRVLFGLDLNILIRGEANRTEAMPAYLYNRNPLDDLRYLLNKDTLYYSLYVLMADGWGEGQTLDEGFTWDAGSTWSRAMALASYPRPEPVAEPLAADAYLADTEANLAVVTAWLEEHPDTEFHLFLSPYSILAWDRYTRLGALDAVLAALERAGEVLLPYENARLYGFLFDREIVENYCDHVHHSGAVCRQLLEKMAAGEGQLTAENLPEILEDWRAFVEGYDFAALWPREAGPADGQGSGA